MQLRAKPEVVANNCEISDLEVQFQGEGVDGQFSSVSKIWNRVLYLCIVIVPIADIQLAMNFPRQLKSLFLSLKRSLPLEMKRKDAIKEK